MALAPRSAVPPKTVLVRSHADVRPKTQWPPATAKPHPAAIPPQAAAAYFWAAREKVPGQTLGVVYVKDDAGHRVRLMEMPEVGSATTGAAAGAAHALQAAYVQDPLLADHLTVVAQDGGAALTLPGAPHPLLVISQDAADELGVAPAEAAQDVIRGIRDNLGPRVRDLVVVSRDTTPLAQMTPEQKRQRAQELRRQGDDAYLGLDRHRAELCYQQAAKLVPDYPIPFLRLAGLYHEQKQDDRARSILEEALQSDSLNPRQKQAILAFQTGLKS